jgi:PAS domain S-box-containing protein
MKEKVETKLERQLAEAQERIRELEHELAETNRGLMAMTMELEQRVEQRTAALRMSEEKFAMAFAGNPAAIAMTTLEDGRFLDVNDTWLTVNGYSREEVIGQSSRKMPIWPTPEAAKRFVDELKAKGSLRGREQEFRRKSGEVFVSQLSASLLTVQGQTVIVSTLVDITDRKRAEATLRRTADELARSNKDLEQFAYVASHDLQEPLRMVSGFLKLLEDKYAEGLDDKARQYIGMAVDGATRMHQMILDLLAYSRAGGRVPQPASVDMAEVVASARANLRAAIEESQALVTQDSLPTVTADAAQMTQVFQNLMGNALKFRREGVRPEIHVGARRDGADWLFWVRDNGIGIPAEQSERVFLIFQRLHTRDKFPGSGIGLAICKKIVERRGGRIWIESKVGEGTTFFFTLPEVITR